jgi:hypothetical protein
MRLAVSGSVIRLFSYKKLPMKTRALQVTSVGGGGLNRMNETRTYEETLRQYRRIATNRTHAHLYVVM